MIEIKLDPKEVNEAVAEAIRVSVLGETITGMITEYCKTIARNHYDNPVKKLVEEEVKKYINTVIQEKYSAEIEKQVRDQITGDVAQRLAIVAIEKFLKGIY